jgi:hypothetical protein
VGTRHVRTRLLTADRENCEKLERASEELLQIYKEWGSAPSVDEKTYIANLISKIEECLHRKCKAQLD